MSETKSGNLTSPGRKIVSRLKKRFPDADCALHHSNALELLVATILSAQCTDERVNIVTPALFKKYRGAKNYATAKQAVFEKEIQSTGFFRNKAKSILACCQELVARHGGEVPDRMEDLVQLPGVGRKTANVVLGTFFKQPAIMVDTHVKRLAERLGLSQESDPDKIELDLQKVFPRKDWTFTSHALIWHGRYTCHARKPECGDCCLADLCPSAVKV
ncbi:MAG: endonuclease III [Armatimonadetes bacterium]|nr:endonuclease III [Armatimonadota bacterium]